MAGLADDRFVPVRAEDVDDLAGLPRRFERFSVDVQLQLQTLGHDVLGAIRGIRDALEDISTRITSIERTQIEHGRRLAALETKPVSSRKSAARK